MNARGTGLVIHHDPRNEKFLLKDSLPRAAGIRKAGPSEFKPKTKAHRQYRYFDQGQTPECTGYSSVTLLATAHPFNNPPLSIAGKAAITTAEQLSPRRWKWVANSDSSASIAGPMRS
jgi:hypothetical protein